VVVCKIVRHDDNCFTHGIGIRALLQHDKALTFVLFTGAEFRLFAIAHTLYRSFDRQGVLHTTSHTSHTTDRIRVALAQALAPESVSLANRQNAFAVQAIQGEQAWVPAHRAPSRGASARSGRI